ncbi:MAG: hypothetical protein AAF721_33915 [Myxococcota bacterium]
MKHIAIVVALSMGGSASGCATMASTPHAPTGLRIGAVSEPSNFEKRERTRDSGRNADDLDDSAPADAAKRRKGAFWAGVILASFGAAGSIGFGLGGRIVQAQLSRGYDDEDLTRDDEDRLRNTGEVMNGLTIGTAAVGLFGVALLSVAYALDHARCGDLPPKREDCPRRRSGRAPAEAEPEPESSPTADAAK